MSGFVQNTATCSLRLAVCSSPQTLRSCVPHRRCPRESQTIHTGTMLPGMSAPWCQHGHRLRQYIDGRAVIFKHTFQQQSADPTLPTDTNTLYIFQVMEILNYSWKGRIETDEMCTLWHRSSKHQRNSTHLWSMPNPWLMWAMFFL